jgi:competence protein ComFC
MPVQPVNNSHQSASSATIPAVQLGGILAAATEALLPGLCPHCDQPLLGRDRGLCRACWSLTVPRAGNVCARCGLPSDGSSEPCLACVSRETPQEATVIWGEHDGSLRSALLALKNRNRDDLAAPLAGRLAAMVAGEPWAPSIDALCWVPSHPLRRFRRPWAAPELLAKHMAKTLGKPPRRLLIRSGLHRQTGRTRARRLDLPRSCFAADTRCRGLKVLLVDDVTTTGTTIRRAAEALRKAGARAVFCAVLAHTPDPRRMS